MEPFPSVTPSVLLTNRPIQTIGAAVTGVVVVDVTVIEERGVGVRVGSVSPVDCAAKTGEESLDKGRELIVMSKRIVVRIKQKFLE